MIVYSPLLWRQNSGQSKFIKSTEKRNILWDAAPVRLVWDFNQVVQKAACFTKTSLRRICKTISAIARTIDDINTGVAPNIKDNEPAQNNMAQPQVNR